MNKYVYKVTRNGVTKEMTLKEFEDYAMKNDICFRELDCGFISIFDDKKFESMVRKLRKGAKFFFTSCNTFVEAKEK